MIQSPSNREQICRSVGARRAAPASVHFPVVGSKLDPRTGDLLSSSGAAPLALRHSLSLHDDSVLALALCSERRLLFVGTQDGEIHAWDTSLFLRVKVLKAHQRAVTDLASLGVEGLLVSAARDGRVRIWNFSSWECVGTIEGLESPVLNIKVIEGILYAGTVSTRILVIDIHSVLAKSEENPGQGISYVDGHRGYIFTVEKSQNPKVLYTGSGDSEVKVWIRSEGLGVELYHTLKGHTDAVTAICEIDYEVNISQHSDTEVERHLIISGGKNGELKLWKLRISNLPESYCVRTINLGDEVLALHRAGEFLLCALRNRKLVIFDVKSIEFICEVYPHSGDVLSFASDGRLLYSGGSDKVVHVWKFDREESLSTQSHSSCNIVPKDLHSFLLGLGLEVYYDTFEKHGVDLYSLGLLNYNDLKDIGIPIGPRRKLLFELQRSLKRNNYLGHLLFNPLETIIRILREFISIPTVSSLECHREDCWRGAKFLESLLVSIGADTRIVQSIPGKNPAVISKIRVGSTHSGSKLSRVIVYGHYDVQPAVKELWESPPFALLPLNGFLYGRGASDNKGPITAMIAGIRELAMEQDTDVEIVMLLDGEEESEGEGFNEAIISNLEFIGSPDVCLIANTYWIGTERPCIVYGMRGALHLKISISGPSHNLHSGVHGGALNEPMQDLIHLLSDLHDKEGKVNISHFYDNVRNLSEVEEQLYEDVCESFSFEDYKNDLGLPKLYGGDSKQVLLNRWRQPTICIHEVNSAYQGTGGRTSAISKEVSANLSIRVVPDQELDVIISQVKKHLTDCFFSLDSGNRLSIEISEHGGWWLADPSSRFFKAAERAVLENWEIPPLYIQEGGTMPISKFLEKTFTAPVIHIPFGQRTDQAHLENERIRLLNLSKGKDVFKSFVREVHSLRNAS